RQRIYLPSGGGGPTPWVRRPADGGRPTSGRPRRAPRASSARSCASGDRPADTHRQADGGHRGVVRQVGDDVHVVVAECVVERRPVRLATVRGGGRAGAFVIHAA